MIYNNYDLILAMGIAWAIYGTINITTIKKNRGQVTNLAVAVIISFSLSLIDHLLRPNPNMQTFTNPIIFITRNSNFLFGPILWLYVKSLLEDKRIKWTKILLHLSPFLLFILLMILFNGTIFKTNILQRGGPRTKLHILAPLRMYLAMISPIVYGVLTILRIRRHRLTIPDFYSSRNIRNTLSWLSILLSAVVIITSLFLIYVIGQDLKPGPAIRNPLRFYLFFPVSFIFLFSLFSRDQQIQEDAKTDFKPKKYKNSVLGESTIENIYNNFIKNLQEKRSFLNP